MRVRQGFAALAAALVCCTPAWGHHEGPPNGVDGFAAGFAHPWLGLDHLLAMVAVGLLAAQLRGRALWILPTAFLGMMIVGGTIGTSGFQPPFVETCIALSVVALGIAVAWGRKYPLAAAATCVAAIGLVHGHAHGTEMPELAAPVLYACGFLMATALLHAAGVLGGVCLVGNQRWEAFLRLSGAAISGAGVLILFGAL